MELSSFELSKLFKISSRTLHHYDQIGLLKPSFRLESGRRVYLRKDFFKLMSIISFKELGFSLDQIKQTLGGYESIPKEIFIKQKNVLNKKIQKLKKMSQELERIIKSIESGCSHITKPCISFEKIDAFNEFYPKELLDKYKSSLTKELGQENYERISGETQENLASAMEYGKKSGEFLNAISKCFHEKKEAINPAVQHLLKKQLNILKLINPYIENKKIYLETRDLMTSFALNHPNSKEEEKDLFLFLHECMTIFANENLSEK